DISSNGYLESGITWKGWLYISDTATLGPRLLVIQTQAGKSGPLAFTVLQRPPAISSISPALAGLGSTIDITLTGTSFIMGGTAIDPIAGITISNVNVISATLMSAVFTVSPEAATGNRNVTVTTVGGTSNIVSLRITDP